MTVIHLVEPGSSELAVCGRRPWKTERTEAPTQVTCPLCLNVIADARYVLATRGNGSKKTIYVELRLTLAEAEELSHAAGNLIDDTEEYQNRLGKRRASAGWRAAEKLDEAIRNAKQKGSST